MKRKKHNPLIPVLLTVVLLALTVLLFLLVRMLMDGRGFRTDSCEPEKRTEAGRSRS